ncbi:PepSY domain-containing protein [Virgibacillus dakarensis]|nr:PepSY domain-containing protein [Virgibacillus dakarensis]
MKNWRKKYVIPTIAVAMIGTTATGVTVLADSDDRDDHHERTQETNVTKEESKQIALEKEPGTVEENELESEFGSLFYEVEVNGEDGNEHEILINARSGEVLDPGSDSRDDDGDDDKYDDDDKDDDNDDDRDDDRDDD